MKKFTVVIVSYKNIDLLEDCLNSIFKYNDIGDYLEVVVVDNSPEDSLINYISNKFPAVITYKNQNNGFGAGNNKGVTFASSEYILFLNPDTVLVEPIFEFAIERFESNSNLSLFGVKLINLNEKKNMSYFYTEKYGLFYDRLIKFLNRINHFDSNSMFISGANMFMRKSDFLEIGKFDENIFMYCEERDVVMRLKELGKEIAFYPQKRIIHLEGKTGPGSLQPFKQRLKSLEYFCEKYDLNFQDRIKSDIRYYQARIFINKVLKKEIKNYSEKKYLLKSKLGK